MNRSDTWETQAKIYQSLSHLAAAFGSPARLKVIQLVSQAPWTVEQLSEKMGESVANTSQHLQKLAKAGLVTVQKKGLHRLYSISSPSVVHFWESFQDLGHELIVDLDQQARKISGLTTDANMAQVTGEVQQGIAVLIDAREPHEFRSTPVEHALSLPAEVQEFEEEVKRLGIEKSKKIYVFCRGRYCQDATDVVTRLQKMGYQASRVQGGANQFNFEKNKCLKSKSKKDGTHG